MAKREKPLKFPAEPLKPDELLTFIEMRGFSAEWIGLKLDNDHLLELQLEIMRDPKRYPVTQGTGCLRKMRFKPSDWNVGKSGATRVCYVYFEEWGIVLLVVVYPKSETESLTDAETEAARKAIERVRMEFSRRFGKGAERK